MKPLDDLLVGLIVAATAAVMALLIVAVLNEALPPGTGLGVQAYPPDPTGWIRP